MASSPSRSLPSRTAQELPSLIPEPSAAREIPLTKGLVALVDAADFDALIQQRWYAHPGRRTLYARARYGDRLLAMHRVILKAPAGLVVDHVNGDGLDNRRANLRLCSGAENSRNRRQHAATATGLKGVERLPYARFRAALWLGGVRQHLGIFDTAHDAGRAYDAAAKHHYGSFAKLNFPEAA